jgi:hypothetical protein
MCTVLLPPGDNPLAVNKYIISYHIISYHIISYHITYHITSYHNSSHLNYLWKTPVTSATTRWIFRTGRGDVTHSGTLCSEDCRSSDKCWWTQAMVKARYWLQALEHFHDVITHSSSNLSQFSLAVCCSHGAAPVRENTDRIWHVTNCLTNQITPWGGLLFNLTVSKLVKQFAAFYVSRGLFTLFKTACHLPLH